VQIVAGDTKVVERGRGDGVYINTAGVGQVAEGIAIGPDRAQAGDRIIVSGTIGDHGIAVMSVREGLTFETEIVSDCAPLAGLTAAMLEVAGASAIHVLRDPTRGGLAATLNESARQSKVGIVIDDAAVPVKADVRSACELLGLDPLHVANEGKLVAIVAANVAELVVECLRRDPVGRDAAIIGSVREERPGMVATRTAIGGTRVVPMPLGDLLPRIC
jgi:hydrogenase expression/formation protein HypE